MGLALSPLRNRGVLITLTFIVIILFTIFLIFIRPDLTAEQTLTQRLAEYQMRVQYLESMYRSHQEDVVILSQYLGTNVTLNGSILDALSTETKSMLRNMSMSSRFLSSLQLPIAFHFLPHLLDDPASLKPAFLMSKGRQGVSIVLGIPTVKREKQSYLLGTLDNLIKNMNEEEQNETMIVVFIGETDLDYVQLVAKQIETIFLHYIESGLIEVISPPISYYPNFDKLRITLNDPSERVKWRSKQNLDFSFLMAYAQPKGILYVQLEDDILAKRGYITVMKNFATEKTAAKIQWLVLDFCELGFIGKMFKTIELPWLITFFQMFYNEKPVDWLLQHLIHTKICNLEKDMKQCLEEQAKLWIHFKPSIFQHIGATSSLKGKVQQLKDGEFGKIPTFYPHVNPPASVRTVIAQHKSHSLQNAYNGESFFWGLLPQADDLVEFIFDEPLILKRFLFRSGNTEYPNDRFYNTTVEVLPAYLEETSQMWSAFNSTNDSYLIVGSFNLNGIAEGSINPKIGKIKEIRLHVHSEAENWVILSEVLIIPAMPLTCKISILIFVLICIGFLRHFIKKKRR